MTAAAVLLAAMPCLYWTQGVESRPALEAVSITRLCVPPESADAWRSAGFTITPVSDAELKSREVLPAPGVTPRPGVASPTRSPWIVANGWRFLRQPLKKYVYDVPAAKAALAAAEAFAYGADALLRVDTVDAAALANLGTMLKFLEGLTERQLPPIADIGVVDDGSPVTGEVMNLLARRNLLYRIVETPSPALRVNIAVGSAAYPVAEAADPSAFALKIRRQLTDEQRTLRLYGSEVVICRLTGDAGRIRLHLVNYGGREIEGLRVRLRGTYRSGDAQIAGAGRLALVDHVAADGSTEFSVPRLITYAVIDLEM
jgi:hypothetical protein